MDSGLVPHHSHHLAGLSLSTSPPPLGERDKRSRWTTSHIDSHMMGDYVEGIPEPTSPIHMEDGEFNPNYDPSPDLTELGPIISKIGTFHDRPTYSSVDPPLTHRRYGMPEDETYYEPTSTSYGSYGMSGMPTHDLAFHVESEFGPNTMLGGTPIPYHAERFGSTSHIAPSIPVVEATSHIPPRTRVSDPIRIPDPR